MDISSLNRPPIDTAPSTSPRHADVASKTEDSKSFDQHLNEQIDQDNAAQQVSESEKSDKNQRSDEVSGSESPVDDSTESRPEEAVVAKGITSEELVQSSPVEVDDAVLLATLQPVDTEVRHQQTLEVAVDHQQILPFDGSDLPPVMEEGDANISPVTVSAVIEVPVKNVDMQQVDTAVDDNHRPIQIIPGHKQSVDFQQSQKQPPVLNLADEAPVTPELMTLKSKITGVSEDVKSAIHLDAKPASVSSIITTASHMQQVPGLTSVSAMHLNSAASLNDPALMANTPLFKSAIPVPLQSPGWSQGVAERVAWMVQGNFQNAEIKLNPAHLGPLEIKMSIHDDKASISFISAHAPVREALDQALPRLREMFEQQGLQLGNVDVSQYSESQQDQSEKFSSGVAQLMNDEATEQSSDTVQSGVMSVDSGSGVNLYA